MLSSTSKPGPRWSRSARRRWPIRGVPSASWRPGRPMRLVGVTVLTSHTPASYGAAIGRDGQPDVAAEVARLARQAMEAGLDGVVASPLEIGVVRSLVRSGGWIVVPGIRPAGSETGDQQRTAEPAAAMRA